MRMLYIAMYYRPTYSGASIYNERMLKKLSERYGLTCDVLTIHWGQGEPVESVGWLTIRRLRLPLPARYRMTKLVRLLLQPLFMLWILSYLRRQGQHYDLVFTMDTSWVSALTARAARAQHLLVYSRLTMIKGKTPAYLQRSTLGRMRLRLLADNVHFILTNPASLVDFTATGISPNQISLITNGVDTGRFHPGPSAEKQRQREALGLPAEGVLCLYVGGIIPRKGIDRLQTAWDQAELDETAHLLLVGPTYTDQPDLLSFTQGFFSWLATTPSATHRPAVDTEQLAAIFRAADIFIFPPVHEGLGNALLEAMACGLACIVTPYLGFSDFIGRHEEHLLVSNPEDMAATIQRLIADPNLRVQLGTQAAQHIQDKFDMEHTLNQYAHLFHLEDTGCSGYSA